MHAWLAVDIGGTKMEAGIVDVTGRIVGRRRAPTEVAEPWAGLIPIIEHCLADARDSGIELLACGVGCGGPMESGGRTVSPLNIHAWRGFPLRSRIEALCGLSVTIDNDAKALALGEGWLGAAVGERNFLAMVVSTGVGGGIVLGGRLLDGAAGNAGHVGHIVVVPGGRPCVCGSAGCLEAEASGTAIEAFTGRAAARAGPAVITRTGTLVGRAVGAVSVLLDLPLAVVAGSVALGYGEPFFAAAQAELDRCAVIEFARGARIRPAGLGADGPLIGAAAVARATWETSTRPSTAG
jgi:glucokinase